MQKNNNENSINEIRRRYQNQGKDIEEKFRTISTKNGENPEGINVYIELSANMKAFLKLIRFEEHKTDSDSVYYLLYGGKQTFSDTSTHPNILVNAWGRQSTAAGAYQILKKTYDDAVKRGYMNDFSPLSQDSFAINKIKARGAGDDVENGNLDGAISKLKTEWVSLPGGSQSHMSIDTAKERFRTYGGTLQK